MSTPRLALRAIAAGQGGESIAVPFALHASARIQERDAEDFVYDATQLANALRDLIDAVDPDGVPVSDPRVLLADCSTITQLLESPQLASALEATRRLRSSQGDRVVLAAVLPGPALIAESVATDAAGAADAVVALGKDFLSAGADLVIVVDDADLPGTTLSTLGNIARFHQALALSHPQARYGLAATSTAPIDEPFAGTGVVVTEHTLARDTDLGVLRDWVATVRGDWTAT